MLFFLKAIIPGGAHSDLFSVVVPIHGYTTKDGTYVSPHQGERKKHIAPISAPILVLLPAAEKPLAAPPVVEQAVDTGRHQAASIGARPQMIVITSNIAKTGAYAKIPANGELEAALKAAFPAIGYFADSKKWYLKGKTAQKRLTEWAASQGDTVQKLQADDDALRASTLKLKRDAADIDAATGPLATPHIGVSPQGDRLFVSFPYDQRLVGIIKQVHGARWEADRKVWSVAQLDRPMLRLALAKMEPILAAEAADRAASVAKERMEADAHRVAVAARRTPVLMSEYPRIGQSIMAHGRIQIIESLGKTFYINEDMPSVYGSKFLGHEGESACYAYLRDPTNDEVRAYEEAQEIALAAADAKRQARSAIVGVDQEFSGVAEMPEKSGAFPVGETVYESGKRVAAYGGGTKWVHANDGSLWRLRGNGGDGDDWSANNLPSTVAHRLSGPLAHELAERLRQAASQLGEA